MYINVYISGKKETLIETDSGLPPARAPTVQKKDQFLGTNVILSLALAYFPIN